MSSFHSPLISPISVSFLLGKKRHWKEFVRVSLDRSSISTCQRCCINDIVRLLTKGVSYTVHRNLTFSHLEIDFIDFSFYFYLNALYHKKKLKTVSCPRSSDLNFEKIFRSKKTFTQRTIIFRLIWVTVSINDNRTNISENLRIKAVILRKRDIEQYLWKKEKKKYETLLL